MSELTIEQKREALIEAGMKIRSNASDATIEAEYSRLGRSEGEPAAGTEIEPATPAAEPEPEPNATIKAAGKPKPETIAEILDRIREERHRTNSDYLGDREPEVIEWARQNLSEEEFQARYRNRI